MDYGLDIDEVPGKLPACATCKHWIPRTRLCTAFKDRQIPHDIWMNGNPHDKSVPGDNGILFEPITPGEQSASQLQ